MFPHNGLNRYGTPIGHGDICNNEKESANSRDHGADSGECEGYKIGADVGRAATALRQHESGLTTCTICAGKKEVNRDFAKSEPSDIVPRCRECRKSLRMKYFARRNYRRK